VVNGVYSFGYGEEGKTVKRAAEVVAVADGETKVFNYSTEHKPLLGDVQLSDGTYTWGSKSGPSDAAQFIGSINAELGNVTAIYIQNAPAKDTIINAVYHYHEEGIIGALSQNKECWQELTINGKTLSPRERLVSVPFAMMSAYSKSDNEEKIFHPVFGGSVPPFTAPGHYNNIWYYDGGRWAYLPETTGRKMKIFYGVTMKTEPNKNHKLVMSLVRRNFRANESVTIQEVFNLQSTSSKTWNGQGYVQIDEFDFENNRYWFALDFESGMMSNGVTLNYLYIKHTN